MSKSIRRNTEQNYKVAFDSVVEQYQSIKHETLEGMKAVDYSKMHNSAQNRANVITVSKTDFVCDVEKTIYGAIGENEHLLGIFCRCYVHLTEAPNTQSPEIDMLRILLGSQFVHRGIHPVSNYFKPKYIDRSKGQKVV